MLRLKELRKERKITQEELSKKLGVTQATLSGWENEKFEMDNKILLVCAKMFGVSVDYILGADEETKKEPLENFERLDEEQTEIISIFDKMSHSQKEEVIKYARYVLFSGLPRSRYDAEFTPHAKDNSERIAAGYKKDFFNEDDETHTT